MGEKKNKLLERRVIDKNKTSVYPVGGVSKATIPKKFRTMHFLKQFFQSELEMLVVMEDGVPFLEIRRVKP
jgi:hypothetical protein